MQDSNAGLRATSLRLLLPCLRRPGSQLGGQGRGLGEAKPQVWLGGGTERPGTAPPPS